MPFYPIRNVSGKKPGQRIQVNADSQSVKSVIHSAFVIITGALKMEEFADRLSLKTLLDHFSEISDERESWRVAYPMPEVLFLVVCATLSACDDFDDIALWGDKHIDFLRNFHPLHHGVPGARWLNILMNRIDPALFSACFMRWASTLSPAAAGIIALDGKTSRRSHDTSTGKQALHMVCRFCHARRAGSGTGSHSGQVERDHSHSCLAGQAFRERCVERQSCHSRRHWL